MNTRIQKRIDEKFQRLQSHRPLDLSVVKKIQENVSLEMVYNSNAIEGNTLSLQETYMILQEGVTIKGKTLLEHLEVKNHASAIDFLYDLVSDNRKVLITEKLIREIHALVVRDDEDSSPGTYRDVEVRITGSEHIPPGAYKLSQYMNDLVQRFRDVGTSDYHPIEFAARLHHDFVAIHPFKDGNGRAGRVLMNIVLMQVGYPLAIIKKEDRQKYYRVLEKAHKGDYSDLINFVALSVDRSLDMYLSAIEKTTKESEKILLGDLSKEFNFSQEYLSLLARQGKIAAHKRGRTWYSSRQAVQRYIDNRERKR